MLRNDIGNVFHFNHPLLFIILSLHIKQRNEGKSYISHNHKRFLHKSFQQNQNQKRNNISHKEINKTQNTDIAVIFNTHSKNKTAPFIHVHIPE